jgi:hypothetical protein
MLRPQLAVEVTLAWLAIRVREPARVHTSPNLWPETVMYSMSIFLRSLCVDQL